MAPVGIFPPGPRLVSLGPSNLHGMGRCVGRLRSFRIPHHGNHGMIDKRAEIHPVILAPPGRNSRLRHRRRPLCVDLESLQADGGCANRLTTWTCVAKDTGITGDDGATGIASGRWWACRIGRHLLRCSPMVCRPSTRGRNRKPPAGRSCADHRPSGGRDAPRLDLPRSRKNQYNEGHAKVQESTANRIRPAQVFPLVVT